MNTQPNVEERPRHELTERLTAVMNAVVKCLETELKPFRLNASQFAILKACLATEGTPVTITTLSGTLAMDAPRISREVHTLYLRGLIKRQRHTTDRRVVLLTMTEEGADLASRIVNSVNRRNERLLVGITDAERDSFHSIMDKIMSNRAAMD